MIMPMKINIYDNIAILIPTYNPTGRLKKLVSLLNDNGFRRIIVVNDGSIDDRILYDIKVEKILGYDFNYGKGHALKVGFDYISRLDVLGVITIDDDLQHDILDIKKIADEFLSDNKIYFGIRDFNKAPLIRRMANIYTSKVFNKIYNYNICDTQTGLRCYPRNIFSKLTLIKGERFEYELNQLKFFVLNGYDIEYIPIKTIYNGSVSHFNVLTDSYKIIKELIKKDYI